MKRLVFALAVLATLYCAAPAPAACRACGPMARAHHRPHPFGHLIHRAR